MAQGKRGESFATVRARTCLRPAGDAEGGFDKTVARLVHKQDINATTGWNNGNGVIAVRCAAKGKGGGSSGFPVQPGERCAVAAGGDGIGEQGCGAGSGEGKDSHKNGDLAAHGVVWREFLRII